MSTHVSTGEDPASPWIIEFVSAPLAQEQWFSTCALSPHEGFYSLGGENLGEGSFPSYSGCYSLPPGLVHDEGLVLHSDFLMNTWSRSREKNLSGFEFPFVSYIHHSQIFCILI